MSHFMKLVALGAVSVVAGEFVLGAATTAVPQLGQGSPTTHTAIRALTVGLTVAVGAKYILKGG